MSTLVFKTIRVGFPHSKIYVYLNGLNPKQADAIPTEVAEEIVAWSHQIPHHEWVKRLIDEATDPFVIVDTDVCFYERVDGFGSTSRGLKGYLIPEFKDPFSRCITRSRLHTSLLFVNPAVLKKELEEYNSKWRQSKYTPGSDLIYPSVYPLKGQTYFNDTASLLYHAVGGEAFSDAEKDAYFHFHFGTFSDQVLPTFPNAQDFNAMRQVIYENPESGQGMWRYQDEWFNSQSPLLDGTDVIDKVHPEDAKEAQKWNVELCKGDVEAMRFCDLWYGYVHGIDDLVDTIQDGRPRMSKAQMISLFFHAAILYNNVFYRQNRELLFPLVLDITNSYSISVDWEKDPQAHRRHLADFMRMAGSRMYSMVALICGGEAHSLEISRKIYESDWVRQHDVNGNPI